MLLYVIILRLVHIVTATLWTGAAVMIAGFITPAVSATGPEGGKFMQRLIQHGRLPLFMNAMAWSATVSGILLYWQVSGGMQAGWITSPRGLGFTIGAVAGILAFIVGETINARAASRLGAIGREIQTAGPAEPGSDGRSGEPAGTPANGRYPRGLSPGAGGHTHVGFAGPAVT